MCYTCVRHIDSLSEQPNNMPGKTNWNSPSHAFYKSSVIENTGTCISRVLSLRMQQNCRAQYRDKYPCRKMTNFNKKAVLSQRWPRDARYISRSWAVAGIVLIKNGGSIKKFWNFSKMAAAAILDLYPLEQTRHVGVAKSERPTLTNGEIIFEEF